MSGLFGCTSHWVYHSDHFPDIVALRKDKVTCLRRFPHVADKFSFSGSVEIQLADEASRRDNDPATGPAQLVHADGGKSVGNHQDEAKRPKGKEDERTNQVILLWFEPANLGGQLIFPTVPLTDGSKGHKQQCERHGPRFVVDEWHRNDNHVPTDHGLVDKPKKSVGPPGMVDGTAAV